MPFEATARLGGVIRAFEELNTSQSAISRHIHNLETALGQKLFQRQGRGVVLTSNGQDYYLAVKSSLERLHAAGRGLRTQTRSVTIACTQEISHCLLLPFYAEIKGAIEEGAGLRVLNCDYDVLHLLLPAGVDIIFEYSAAPTDPSAAKLLNEEIVPVASPAFVERFERVLARHPRQWSSVPRLDVAQRDQTWATWASWFRAHDCDAPKASVEPFENYEYLLEAAARGEGMALAWNGFVNRYLESGRLVKIRVDWLRLPIALYAVLTQGGHSNRNAISCLKQLAALGERLGGTGQASPQRQPTRGKESSFKPL
jgi:LysR family glycine cleavage system transcriptional activator